SRTSRVSVPAQRNSASSGWARTLRTTFAIGAPSRGSCRLRPRAGAGVDRGPLLARGASADAAPPLDLLLHLRVDQRLALEIPVEGPHEGRLGQELVAAVQAQERPVGRQRRGGGGLAEECPQGQVTGQVGPVNEAVGPQILQLGLVGFLLDCC